MSIIGPDIDSQGTGLLNWFMKQQGTIQGFVNVKWNGVTTLELAEAVSHAIRCNLCGVYQLVPTESINKYQLLILFQNVFGKKDVTIELNEKYIVDKTLLHDRFDFDFQIKDYSKQIENLKIWIERHATQYPSYYTVM